MNYLVCGNQEGTIRFYDFNFKIAAWFEDCLFSNVKSISFSATEPKISTEGVQFLNVGEQMEGEAKKSPEEIFKSSDFLVADENALICMLQSTLFEEIEPNKKKGHTIMHGIKSKLSAISIHPRETLLAIAGADGFVLLWDYMKKGDPISNYEYFGKDRDKEKDKKFEEFQYFTCIEFVPPNGDEILLSTHNGEIKVMDAATL